MTTRTDRPGSLGRGLGALIPHRSSPPGSLEIPLDRISSNPSQPRQRFGDERLAELAASIREHGVVQPILVTKAGDGYQLIAGERRVRAARLAGLDRIPAVIRHAVDREQLEIALVENLQRADLDPIEAAHAYRQLMDQFGLSQEQVAVRVGRARSTIANTVRLIDLDPAVQSAIVEGAITEGHGRALGGLDGPGQRLALGTVLGQSLSVRQTEELVRRLREPRPLIALAATPVDPDHDRVEEGLRRALGTKVSLARSRRGGRIVIEFYSDEELGRLYDQLVGGSS